VGAACDDGASARALDRPARVRPSEQPAHPVRDHDDGPQPHGRDLQRQWTTTATARGRGRPGRRRRLRLRAWELVCRESCNCTGRTLTAVVRARPERRAVRRARTTTCNGMIDTGAALGRARAAARSDRARRAITSARAPWATCARARRAHHRELQRRRRRLQRRDRRQRARHGRRVPDRGDGSALCTPGVTRCIAGMLRCQGGVPFHAPVCTCTPDQCATPTVDGGSAALCPGGRFVHRVRVPHPVSLGRVSVLLRVECRAGFCVPPLLWRAACAATRESARTTSRGPLRDDHLQRGADFRGGVCSRNTCYALGCPRGQLCRMNMRPRRVPEPHLRGRPVLPRRRVRHDLREPAMPRRTELPRGRLAPRIAART